MKKASIYIASIIKKLSLSWSKFTQGLEQKFVQFSLDGLVSALGIEDKHHFPKNQTADFKVKALIIEDSHKSRPNKCEKNGPKRFFFGMEVLSRMTIRVKLIIEVEGNVGCVTTRTVLLILAASIVVIIGSPLNVNCPQSHKPMSRLWGHL